MLEEFEMGIMNSSSSLTIPLTILLVLWKHSELNAFLIAFTSLGSVLPNEIISDFNRNKSNEMIAKVAFIQAHGCKCNPITGPN